MTKYIRYDSSSRGLREISAPTGMLQYKGTVATVADLPQLVGDDKIGWYYHVTADGGEYAWNGSTYDLLGRDDVVVDVRMGTASIVTGNTATIPVNQPGGVPVLDNTGKVPSSMLPSITVGVQNVLIDSTSIVAGGTATIYTNVSNGLAKLTAQGKLPSSILPDTGNVADVRIDSVSIVTGGTASIITNVPNGLAKLDSTGKLTYSLIPANLFAPMAHTTAADAHASLFSSKQNTLIAGDNITITGSTISAISSGAPADYTAFEVFAHTSTYPANTMCPLGGFDMTFVELPAQCTEKFVIRSSVYARDMDVSVDWGDGTTTVIRDCFNEDGTLIPGTAVEYYDPSYANSERIYQLTHTYVPNGEWQKFIVRIYGRSYFSLNHNPSYNTQYAYDSTYCLLSDCMSASLPIASHIIDISSLAINCTRLFNIRVGTYDRTLAQQVNMANLFSGCTNLKTAYGFKNVSQGMSVRSCGEMFKNCSHMTVTDFVIPQRFYRTASASTGIFEGCSALTNTVQSLIPEPGMLGHKVSASRWFYGCSSLTGTVMPADLLWNCTGITWLDTSECFTGCSAAVRALVPVSWGGTLS